MLLSTACALSSEKQQEQIPIHTTINHDLSKHQWWSFKFRMNWPDNTEVAWHLDALIAEQIAAPVVHQYARHIPLFRFHRRAARDIEGHQFSLFIYSTRDLAIQVNTSLRENITFQRLLDAGYIKELVNKNFSSQTHPNIEDKSWADWSKPVRKAWPHYVMGISLMWLSLVEQYSDKIQTEDETLDTLIDKYKLVDKQISTTWRNEGSHAFLHHLNALFGYKPIVTKQRSNF